MRKNSLLLLFLAAILLSCGGCRLWDELNTPVRKQQPKTQEQKPEAPESSESSVLPEGSTSELNAYEKEYLKQMDADFEKRRKQNYRKVFGGSGD